MHGGDGVAEGGYDDAGDQMHGLHDDSRTTDGAHSFFSRLRKREEGVDDKGEWLLPVIMWNGFSAFRLYLSVNFLTLLVTYSGPYCSHS